MKISVEQLQQFLNKHDKGVLSKGNHYIDSGAYCALECINAMQGRPWGDCPVTAEMPDIRLLNDGPWKSNRERTKHMLPMLSALSDLNSWPVTQQKYFFASIAVRTVREIISQLPNLPKMVQVQCLAVTTLKSAAAAVNCAAVAFISDAHAFSSSLPPAAASAYAYSSVVFASLAVRFGANVNAATYAAFVAANAASAIRAASPAGTNVTKNASTPLITACRIWCEAAEEAAKRATVSLQRRLRDVGSLRK